MPKQQLRQEQCPRAGFIELHSAGRVYLAPTKCKTWSCKVCRNNLLSLVKMKMEYGCLILGPCFFTTLTLPNGALDAILNAHSVRKAWEPFLRNLKSDHYPNIAWIKIPELTKRNQPHLHLILGGIGTPLASCLPKKPPRVKGWRKNWLLNGPSCACVAHRVGLDWYEQTGAYIIDCRPVYNPKGLANYLGKYLTKSFLIRGAMEDAGFLRRYSTSRNWPGGSRLRLAGTNADIWEKTLFHHRDSGWRKEDSKVAADRLNNAMRSEGTDLAMELAALKVRKFKAHQVKKGTQYVHTSI